MPDVKKIIKISWRVLKLLALMLFIALIIAAIYFQAPWKVTALLLIILVANVLLPKGEKRWFWVAAGVVVIALIVWVFLPEDNIGWKPYTFDKELAAIEAKRAVPDSENAAIIYNQLLADANNASEPNLPGMCETRSDPWLNKDYPEIAQWLKNKENTLSLLIQASKKEFCRFPVKADFYDTADLNRLSVLRKCARLLIRFANNDWAENRTDAAMEKYFCILQMAKHMYRQPAMTDFLVAIALESLSTGQLKKFIITGNPTDEQLTQIEKILVEIKHDWTLDWPMILDCEKLLCKNMLGTLIYEANPKGKVRFSHDSTAVIRAQQLSNIPPPRSCLKKSLKANTILMWFFMPSTPQEAGRIIDHSYEKYYAMAKPDFDWTKAPDELSAKPKYRLNYQTLIELMTGMMGGSCCSIHDIYLRNIANQRGSELIIGLRRFKNKIGQWPESLDEIKNLVPAEAFIDPLNTGSFVYRPTVENFILYSKGKNGIDENGKYQTHSSMDSSGNWTIKTKEDDWLIWPNKSCDTEKECSDGKQQ